MSARPGIRTAAIVAVDDLVVVPTGYGMFGQLSGNVLLAFEIANSL